MVNVCTGWSKKRRRWHQLDTGTYCNHSRQHRCLLEGLTPWFTSQIILTCCFVVHLLTGNDIEFLVCSDFDELNVITKLQSPIIDVVLNIAFADSKTLTFGSSPDYCLQQMCCVRSVFFNNLGIIVELKETCKCWLSKYFTRNKTAERAPWHVISSGVSDMT